MPVKRGFREVWDDNKDGRRGDKPVNTHDTLNKGDYYAMPGSHSWSLGRAGYRFKDPEGQSTVKLGSHFDKRSGMIVFKRFSELAAFAKANLGIEGWVRDQFGGYHPCPPGVTPEVPCSVVIGRTEGRWTSFRNCDKVAVTTGNAGMLQGDDEPICKFHAGVNAKRDAREAKWREEWDEQDRQRNRSAENERAEQDACEALNEHGIKAKPATGDDGFHHGEVRVQAEDLLALAREVEQYRRVLGEDALS